MALGRHHTPMPARGASIPSVQLPAWAHSLKFHKSALPSFQRLSSFGERAIGSNPFKVLEKFLPNAYTLRASAFLFAMKIHDFRSSQRIFRSLGVRWAIWPG